MTAYLKAIAAFVVVFATTLTDEWEKGTNFEVRDLIIALGAAAVVWAVPNFPGRTSAN